MDLLARREHSAFELKRKLIEREFPADSIDVVISELQKEGLQSDERFSACYVRYRSEKGFGSVRIKGELRERGISDDLITDAINILQDSWFDLAKKTREKKFGARIPTDFYERNKQMLFLQYKGFTLDQIQSLWAQ